MRKRALLCALALLATSVLAQDRRVVIDVRTPAEFAQGHVPTAINIDHTQIAQRIGEAQVGKDDLVIVYCRSGRRSAIAQQTLQRLGYSRVENYGGLNEARVRLQARP